MNADRSVVDRVMAWGAALKGFNRGHAMDGTTLAQCVVMGVPSRRGAMLEGIGSKDENSLYHLALNTSWIFWLDDRFDEQACNAGEMVDLSALEQLRAGMPSTPEALSIALLSSAIEDLSADDDAKRLWAETAIDMFHAFHNNALFSRQQIAWSYAEYLENGESSSGVMHFIAAVSLLYGFDMPARAADPAFQRMLRNLSLSMRLENDLASIDKERAEGERANALLVMEQFTSQSQAKEFVAEQRVGYERMLLRDLDGLPPEDPFLRIMKIMLQASHAFYSTETERYSSRPVSLGAQALAPRIVAPQVSGRRRV